MNSPLPRTRAALAAAFALALAGCASIPADALKLGPAPAANRAAQTRTFRADQQSELLAASAGVLQDLGFTLEESETKLGVITASRQLTARRPLNGSEVAVNVAGTVFLPYVVGPFAAYRAIAGIKEPQMVRISLVTSAPRAGADSTGTIRVTAQRLVYTDERFTEVKSAEPLDDPQFYAEFFARLETSALLEKQKDAL